MSISDRKYDSRLSLGARVNALVFLIAACMIVFVVLAFFRALSYLRFQEGADITTYFEQHILSLVALPTSFKALMAKPWTLLLHQLAHTSIWQLFGNMLWLWCFGFVFADLTGNRKLIPVFLYGSIVGGIAFLLTGSFIKMAPGGVGQYFGAGAGIMALAVAATTVAPRYKVLAHVGGGIPIWMITILYLAIDMATVPVTAPGVYIAHLAGGITGFAFIFLLRNGWDGSDWMNHLYDWVSNLFNPDKPAKLVSMQPVRSMPKRGNSVDVESSPVSQHTLDAILDKIHTLGYDRLTANEKEILTRASHQEVKK